MSKKSKLIARLQSQPKNFTWDEAVTLMKQSGFTLLKPGGSARMFRHVKTGFKVRLHEPHPENTLKPYMVDILLEGLKAAGEL